MSGQPFNPEQAAAKLLNRSGISAIWDLHLLAAKLYRKGDKPAAGLVIDIADAAERVWLRRRAADRSP
jgi:hypothetical protein